MQHTGDEVLQDPALAGEDPSAQRVLLTLAVRDYGNDDDADAFAEGIDQQLDAVRDWWQTSGPLPAFRQVRPPELKTRDDVEDFLREQGVRELRGHALLLFVTGHGIPGRSDTHFLRLPASVEQRPLATAVRTSDIIAAALDSHVDNVLVIVNTCFAGGMHGELAALHKDIRHSRRRKCNLDVLVTCGHDSKIQVLRFPTLLRAALERLRRNAGITTPYLSVPDFMAEYARGLREDEERTFKLQRLVDGGDYQPSPCLPNPGYVHLTEVLGATQRHEPLAAEYWLDRATGRTQESDHGWYFRGRKRLNQTVASFLGPHSPRGVLLITGCAGSGKSAVLARAVTLSDLVFRNEPLYKTAQDSAPLETIPPEGSVTAAVLARHLDAAQVAADLLRGLGERPAAVEATSDPAEVWSRQIQDYVRACGQTVTIVLDGLDEAEEQLRIIGDVLAPLEPFCRPLVPGQRHEEGVTAAVPAVRLLIGVRSSRPDGSSPGGSASDELGLLRTLKDTFPSASVQRTDSDSTKDDIAEYIAALIGDAMDASSVQDVATAVAKAVWPSFIDARLAGDQLRSTTDPMTLARSEGWHTKLRRGIRGLLQHDLQQVQGLSPDVALALLQAAAYAKGQGVPWGEVWPAIAGVFLMPKRLTAEEWDTMIEKLLSGRLSGYLAHAVEDDRRVYRPAHEELVDVLLDPDAGLLDSGGRNV
ncbi:ATP-binding protein [Streptomyces sp. NBC_00988]|uniref:AAA family ATPase n=1 Tax=Streptomyces sp. NBC_00988 TaxID=2903704 RepID=UPI003867C546|nr:ATP-binding protein [Streptomyces sp. NBC_00988]